ncbi:MAG: TfoX/Sxy family protein [Verrucomicrobia bacterium]|nr:TfoX/Sxy family protein [Verrucomicrobiota bacterium]
MSYVLDQLSRWGEVSVRRMFGGAGLYRDGRMFGLIAGDVAYLKVDDASRGDFLKAGSAPFNPYPDLNKAAVLSYYEIPSEVLENRDELCRWAQRSLDIQKDKKASLASRNAKKA